MFPSRDAVCCSQDPVGSNKCSPTSGVEGLQRNLPWPAVWTGFFSVHHAAGVGRVAGQTTPRHYDKKHSGEQMSVYYSLSKLDFPYGCIHPMIHSYFSFIIEYCDNSPAATPRRRTSIGFIPLFYLEELVHYAELFMGSRPDDIRNSLGGFSQVTDVVLCLSKRIAFL